MNSVKLIIHRRSSSAQSLLIYILIGSSILMFASSSATAQSQDSLRIPSERYLERAIDEIDPETSELDLEELVEFLESLAANPVNINRASVQDLMQVPGIDFRLAEMIITYREEAPFTTVDELIHVNGLGTATLDRIRPFVTAGSGLELTRDLYLTPKFWTQDGRFEGFSRYQRTLQEQEGYRRADSLGGFLGQPFKYYQRFRYRSRYLSANLTQEKDPGEPLYKPAGFDYTSWHLAVSDLGNLQTLVIGDYSISYGQGLLLWSGGAFGKGRDVINGVAKNDRGIRPFTSAQEYNGFRGVAASYGDRIQISGFYSSRNRTASVNQDGTVHFPTKSGLHRTVNERRRRNSLGQTTYGGRIRARLPIGFAGVSAFRNEFSNPVVRGSQPFQLYNFSGTTLSGYSADLTFLIRNMILFGEAAYTGNGGYGLITGADFEVGRNTGLILSYRNYGKKLQSIFGAGFGEQSGTPGNEEGFYIGLEHNLSERVSFSGYFDHFRFSAPRFQTRQPTSGFDWLGFLEIDVNPDLNLYGLLRFQSKEEDYNATDHFGREIRLLGSDRRASGRVQAEYQVHPKVRLRTRLDLNRTEPAGEETGWGFLVFQDLRVGVSRHLRIDARITLFETDGFDSRVYQFENDLLYVLSNRVLFDQGQRMYILLNYQPSRWLEFWLKLSTTLYENRNVISSGLNQINGKRRSDMGIQARIRF